MRRKTTGSVGNRPGSKLAMHTGVALSSYARPALLIFPSLPSFTQEPQPAQVLRRASPTNTKRRPYTRRNPPTTLHTPALSQDKRMRNGKSSVAGGGSATIDYAVSVESRVASPASSSSLLPFPVVVVVVSSTQWCIVWWCCVERHACHCRMLGRSR